MAVTNDSDTLTVALITDVFVGADAEARLTEQLAAAREMDAELALLPELPLDTWCPRTTAVSADDAEPPGGRRQEIQSRAARAAGIGLVGGAIVREPRAGVRHNRALVFAKDGRLIDSYAKVHLPDEAGFFEAHHYRPGTEPPRPIRAFGLPFGIQICSDINRGAWVQLLTAFGAEMIFVPRATPGESYERWKLVLRAAAVTGAVYVVSTNRPAGEDAGMVGGPSVVIDPFGEVLLETTEPVMVARLHRFIVRQARTDYPGYLALPAELYARAWDEIAREPGGEGAS